MWPSTHDENVHSFAVCLRVCTKSSRATEVPSISDTKSKTLPKVQTLLLIASSCHRCDAAWAMVHLVGAIPRSRSDVCTCGRMGQTQRPATRVSRSQRTHDPWHLYLGRVASQPSNCPPGHLRDASMCVNNELGSSLRSPCGRNGWPISVSKSWHCGQGDRPRLGRGSAAALGTLT